MNIRELINDEDAVSPVIGVILMVAITVILAAVIASFVLGLGEEAQNTTPQASFNFDLDQSGSNDVVQITHSTGDTISNDRVTVASTSNFAPGAGNDTSGISGGSTDRKAITDDADGSTWVDSDLTAGTSFSIVGDTDLDGATIRLIYEQESGDSSSTLATWEGPNA